MPEKFINFDINDRQKGNSEPVKYDNHHSDFDTTQIFDMTIENKSQGYKSNKRTRKMKVNESGN